MNKKVPFRKRPSRRHCRTQLGSQSTMQELLCCINQAGIGSLYNGHGRALIVALAVLTDCLNGHASVPQGETENVKRKAIRLDGEQP